MPFAVLKVEAGSVEEICFILMRAADSPGQFFMSLCRLWHGQLVSFQPGKKSPVTVGDRMSGVT